MREPASPKTLDSRSTSRRGWLWLLVAILALGAALVVALPSALRYGIERWFYAHGASNVTIAELHANPFTGDVRLQNLVVDNPAGNALRAADVALRFRWQGLWERRLLFDTLNVRGANLLIDDPSVAALHAANSQSWPVTFRRVQLSDVALDVKLRNETVTWHIGEGLLEPWSSRAEDQTRVSVTGSLAGAPMRLRGTLKLTAPAPQGGAEFEIDDLDLSRLAPFKTALRDLQGSGNAKLHIQWLRDAENRLQLLHEGTIRLHDLRATGSDTDLHSDETLWAGKGEVQFSDDGARFQQQGLWKLTQMRLDLPGGSYHADTLEWHGKMAGQAHLRRPTTVAADGTLEVRPLEFRSANTDLALAARRGHWQGILSQGVLDVPGGVSAAGRLQMSDLRLTRPQQGVTLLSAAQADLRDFDMKGTYSFTAGKLELLRFQVLAPPQGPDEPLMRGEGARFETVVITDRERFTAARLDLDEMQLLLRKQPDGHWYGLTTDRSPEPGSANPNSAAATSRVHWRIERVAVRHGENTVRFEDQSVRPTFARTLKLQRFSLAELDSGEPRRPNPMTLQGAIADGTRVVAVGKLQPFSERLNLSLKAKVYRFPLAPLTPYSSDHLGIRISAGRLDVESNLHVIDGALRSENELLVRGLQLQSSGDPSQALHAQLRMPVPVAVALVRNADRTARIQVPLRGQLDAPDFHLGSAFDRALGSALHDAALANVRTTLHPFDIADARNGSESAAGLRLEPLLFRAGSADLNPVTNTYLRRLATLLQRRPAVRLQICGIVTESDRAAADLQPDLQRNRTEAVLHGLTKDRGIDRKRLESCTPDPAPDSGRPRAELLLL